jgi:hypothetical protein
VNTTSLRKYRPGLPYVLIAVYILFSIYYTFERMLNTDNSFQLFHIINTRNFFFQEHRIGVWPTQLPLLIGVYLHLPMKMLLYIYSLSFPLEYFLILWINLKIFKCREAALATILSLIIGVAYTFFFTITETHQILAICCLLYGLLYAKEGFKSRFTFYAWVLLVITWCLLTHPISIFTIVFVVGISFLQKRTTHTDVFVMISFCFIASLVKYLVTPSGSYDGKLYHHLFEFKQTAAHFFSLYPFQYLVSKMPGTYYSALVIAIIVCFKYKRYTELLFTIICYIIFTTMIILVFSAGDCDAMMEKSFMPGIFMFVFLYCILYYENGNSQKYYLLTLILCSLSFINIMNAGNQFKARLNILTGVLNQMDKNSPKVIVSFSDFDQDIVRLNHWATSTDALMLSKCLSGESKTIFMTEDKNHMTDYTDARKPDLFLYLPWELFWTKEWNTTYFNLPSVPYKIYKANPPEEIRIEKAKSMEEIKAAMKKNPTWMDGLRKRSIEKKITLDSMMIIEGSWIMEQEKQEKK